MKIKFQLFCATFLCLLFSAVLKLSAAESAREYPSVKIGGYAQVRFNWSSLENSTPTYTIPAARIELKANVSDDISYHFSMDSGGADTLKLYDSHIRLAYTKLGLFDIKIGQMKYNFSREQATSDADLELINKSYAVSALVSPTREIGAEISRAFNNIPLKPFIAAGGFNGSGPNAPAQNDYGLAVVRGVITPTEGLSVGGSYYDGKIGAKKTDKKRYGYEILYENRKKAGLPLLIKGEYLGGVDERTNKNGYYLTTGYRFFPVAQWEMPEIMALLRYDYYDTNAANSDDEISRLTLGTIFQYNRYYSFRLNYEFRSETPAVSNDLLTLQFQVKF